MHTFTCFCLWGIVVVETKEVGGTGWAVAAATGKCMAVWGCGCMYMFDSWLRIIMGFWPRSADDWRQPGVAQDRPGGKEAPIVCNPSYKMYIFFIEHRLLL